MEKRSRNTLIIIIIIIMLVSLTSHLSCLLYWVMLVFVILCNVGVPPTFSCLLCWVMLVSLPYLQLFVMPGDVGVPLLPSAVCYTR